MSKRHKVPVLLRVIRIVFPILERWAPFLATRLFVWCFFMPLRYPTPSKETKLTDKATKFSILAAGKRVQVYSWGEGPVICMVHGWAGRAGQFRELIPRLVDAGYRVVAFDGPAHGQSEGKHTSILEFSEALVELVKKTGQPEAIVTHSFGGVATLYAIAQGLPVTRLVNIASPTIGAEIVNTFLKAVKGTDKTGIAFNAYMVHKYGRPFSKFSGLYLITQITTPLDLLLIYDDMDSNVIMKHGELMKERYPEAELFRTSGLGHTRILRDDQVIRKVVGFLAKEKQVIS